MNRVGLLKLLRGITQHDLRTTSGGKNRPLRLESLETRQVLAASVVEFTPTNSGFVVELSEQIQTENLNLIDSASNSLGPADVTLQGSTSGAIRGSLIVDGTTLTFVATGGPLAADTYTVTMRSAANGFVDLADGELLDGEYNGSLPSGNGTPGGDFVFQFTVAPSASLVVGIPDFARGPSQPVQAPVAGSETELPDGLAVQLSDATGVTSVTVTIAYDPSLLNVSDVQLGADAPTGSQVEANLSVPGQVTIAFFALAPLTSGPADIVELIATVPENAPYGSAHSLRITSLDVNAGNLAARGDDALHVVAFAGDANANRRYDAEDARLIARVGVGLDTGFATVEPTSTTSARTFPTIDPRIIGDVTGTGGISPLDASDVLRRVVGLSVPNLPPLPSSQAPFGLTLSNLSLNGNQSAGTTVGSFSTNDPDAGDTFTYALVAGSGDTDNASFTINGNTLVAATALTSTKGSYSIRVSTTDSTNKVFVKTFVITVTAGNTAPTDISLSSDSFPENTTVGTTLATLSTTDANTGDTFTYSLISGNGDTDNAKFQISGNQLLLNQAVDFETQSTFTIRVRSTDSGGLSFEKVLTLNATNVNEAPTAISLSSTQVLAGAAIGTQVGGLSTTDPDTSDTHTYTLVSGSGATDNASFAINGNTLVTAAVFDFSTQTSYSIRIRSTDAAGQSTEQIFTGTIVQSTSNIAPTDISLSSSAFSENTASGTAIATLSTTDANAGDTFTYSLVAGNGDTSNPTFQISGNQLLLVQPVDFETQSAFSIRVRSTDSGGLFVEKVLTLTSTNVNEAPTGISLTATQVLAGAAVGAQVGGLSTTDQDNGDSHTYTLVSGSGDTDNASFTISGNTLLTAAVFDVATQTIFSIRIRSTDAAGEFTEQIFTGTVLPSTSNIGPVDIEISNSAFAESTASGTAIATLTTIDANVGDTFTYSLIAGDGDTDNAKFQISGDQLVLNEVVDFESQSTFSIRVHSTDSGGLSVEKVLTLTTTDVNEAPTAISLSSTQILSEAPIGTVVGGLSSTDQDSGDSHTYTLVSGSGDTDNAMFTITENNTLVTAAVFDFATQTSYTIRIRSTDAGGEFTEQIFTGSIIDNAGNVAPTDIALSAATFAENTASGTAIATLTTTDANTGDTFTYSLIAGNGDTDNAKFQISGDQLLLNEVVDFETQSVFSIRVQSTDTGGLSVEKVLTLTVTDVNEAPTAISLSSTQVLSGAAIGSQVGGLSTADQDSGDSHTYTLVAGSGDTDNAAFAITGNTLVTAAVFDFATQTSYSIRIRSTDVGGEFTEQIITGSIVESTSNVAPTDISLSASIFAEDTTAGTSIATLTTTDANAGDSFTYSLIAGNGDTDNAKFQISGDQLVLSEAVDFETQSVFSIRVQSTDAGGLSVEKVLTLTVTDVNEAATELSLSNSSISDGSESGTLVATISANDPDAADTLTYTLVTGEGDTDNASFSISGDQLLTGFTADLDAQASYSVRIRVTDSAGQFFEQSFSLTVVEPAIAPTDIELSNNVFAEDTASGMVVGQFTTVDASASDSHTYTLVAGEGDSDNTSFQIVNNELLTATTFDFETAPSLSIRVQSTDSTGLSVQKVFTLTLTNVNEAPTALTISKNTIADLQSSGAIVGLLNTTDPDAADTHTYSLIAGSGDTDNAAFQIVDGTLTMAANVDAAVQDMYSVRIRSQDAGGLAIEQILEIIVSAQNVAPTAIQIDNSSIPENASIGTVVGNLSTTDGNTIDTHVYSLVSGEGDADNAHFTIVGNQLISESVFDFETQSELKIRVRSVDPYGLSIETMLTISVVDQVE